MESTVKLEEQSPAKRTKTMLRVDLRRMLRSKLIYILVATALLIPIVMLVMLTAMDGMETVNQQTGEITVVEAPESAWESIGTLPADGTADSSDGDAAAAMGNMDIMAMCNINMMFMLVAVFVGLFISDDFRSGYSKNLFTVRAKKGDYVISKTVTGFIAGALMIIAYFIGSMLGGAITGMSFDLGTLTVYNVIMCILAKLLLMLVFVPIYVIVSVSAKHMAWLSICGLLGAGMLLFMMVGMISPLDSTVMHVLMSLAGGAMFSFGIGAFSKLILKKTSLV